MLEIFWCEREEEPTTSYSDRCTYYYSKKSIIILHYSWYDDLREKETLGVKYSGFGFKKLFQRIFGSVESTGKVGPDDSPEQGG